MAGDEESEEGFEGGADEGFWNIFLMSIFGLLTTGVEVVGVGDEDEAVVGADVEEAVKDVALVVDADDDGADDTGGGTIDDLEDIEAFPFV